jgi:peptidoglycan/xylan/chitin deacetylase (PgdA/CDA1 family)
VYRHLLLVLALGAFAQPRQVAITIDDLPRGGDTRTARSLAEIRAMTEKLLRPLRSIPVIGFVNAGRDPQLGDAGLQSILRLWTENGATLGNHTWSHPDLNSMTLAEFEDDILQGEPAITRALGHRPVYFRHPFLNAGPNEATHRGLDKFLAGHDYRIAPVTLDNSDWLFAGAYTPALAKDPDLAARVRAAYIPYMESIFAFFEERSKEVVGRQIPQILLIHANQLNADTMPDLLAMMRRRGYRFISLEEALKDEAYQQPDEYFQSHGVSWLHRWAKTKGMTPKNEPEDPAGITEVWRKFRQVQ